jgi:hypothetical protein
MSTRMLPKLEPLRNAKSSTPSTVPPSGIGRARNSRNRVVRDTSAFSKRVIRAPGRLPSTKAIFSSGLRSSGVRQFRHNGCAPEPTCLRSRDTALHQPERRLPARSTVRRHVPDRFAAPRGAEEETRDHDRHTTHMIIYIGLEASSGVRLQSRTSRQSHSRVSASTTEYLDWTAWPTRPLVTDAESRFDNACSVGRIPTPVTAKPCDQATASHGVIGAPFLRQLRCRVRPVWLAQAALVLGVCAGKGLRCQYRHVGPASGVTAV